MDKTKTHRLACLYYYTKMKVCCAFLHIVYIYYLYVLLAQMVDGHESSRCKLTGTSARLYDVFVNYLTRRRRSIEPLLVATYIGQYVVVDDSKLLLLLLLFGHSRVHKLCKRALEICLK
jgi:hypothetical protein